MPVVCVNHKSFCIIHTRVYYTELMSFETDRFLVLTDDENPLQALAYDILYNGFTVPSVEDVSARVHQWSYVMESMQHTAMCTLNNTPALARSVWESSYSISGFFSAYTDWKEGRYSLTSLQFYLLTCVLAFFFRALYHNIHRRMLYKRHYKMFKVL